MQSKILLKQKLLVIFIIGFPVLLALFVDSLSRNYQSFVDRDTQNYRPRFEGNVYASKEQALPSRLKIPIINVDATIESAGVTAEGEVAVPKDSLNVSWFNLGPRPGELGNAVISGHYGWRNNISAVFDNLHRLQKGDKIYVEDEKGTTTVFVVHEMRTYDPKSDAPDVFNSSDGRAHLNLITCEGVWNKAEKSYSKRLVVFTDKEE